MAEVIKSAVIKDGDFFSFIETNMEKIKTLDDTIMEEVVFRSAGIKAEVVAQDELDMGLRNILNFGHTVGHAIETVSDFEVEHGQAVAIGMMAEARIAQRMGLLDSSELTRLKDVIAGAGLPVEIPKLDTEKMIEAIKYDKKIVAGKVRFVLPRAMGDVVITDEVNLPLVEEVLGG